MRKTTLLRSLGIFLFSLLFTAGLSAQLLVEDFDYTLGSSITDFGWSSHSSAGTNPILVTNGLSFSGYAGSGIGGAANVSNTGEDDNITFTPQTSGTLYVAFMIQTEASNSAGYFLHLGPSPMGTTFNSRIFINAAGTGVGIATGSTASNYTSNIIPGTPTLIVLKHDFTANTTNIYVLNTFSATEPSSADITFSETYTSVGTIALRQYNAAQRVIVDGIRIGNTWAEACAPASTTAKVATPTFTVVPGKKLTAQTVGIVSATDGASIYYTTDGTNPDNTGNGTLYSSPISVSATSTVKAIAYKTGYDNSSIGYAKYTFPTEVSNISDLRNADASGFYKLTGEAVITYQTTAATGKPKFIQDATAGIMLYDGSGNITTAYNQYDGISNIIGTLSTYNGMLEFIPLIDPGAATSSNNTVTPIVVAVSDLANYPGQLVKVNAVTISETGDFAAATNYTVNQGTSTGTIRTSYTATDLPYIGTAIPTETLNITGVVNIYTTAQLLPRTAADFQVATGVNNPSASNNKVYAAKGNLMVDTDADQTVEVYNATGQKLLTQPVSAGLNTISVQTKGLVFVKLGQSVSKVIL